MLSNSALCHCCFDARKACSKRARRAASIEEELEDSVGREEEDTPRTHLRSSKPQIEAERSVWSSAHGSQARRGDRVLDRIRDTHTRNKTPVHPRSPKHLLGASRRLRGPVRSAFSPRSLSRTAAVS